MKVKLNGRGHYLDMNVTQPGKLEGFAVQEVPKEKKFGFKKLASLALTVASFIPGPVGVVAAIGNAVMNAATAIKSGNIMGVVSAVAGGISGAASLALGTVSTAVSAVASKVQNIANGVASAMNAVKNKSLGSIFGAIASGASGVANFVGDAAGSLGQKASQVAKVTGYTATAANIAEAAKNGDGLGAISMALPATLGMASRRPALPETGGSNIENPIPQGSAPTSDQLLDMWQYVAKSPEAKSEQPVAPTTTPTPTPTREQLHDLWESMPGTPGAISEHPGEPALSGAAQAPSVDALVDEAHLAMKGLGTDEKALFKALAAIPPGKRQEFKNKYDAKYEDLNRALDGDLSNIFGGERELAHQMLNAEEEILSSDELLSGIDSVHEDYIAQGGTLSDSSSENDGTANLAKHLFAHGDGHDEQGEGGIPRSNETGKEYELKNAIEEESQNLGRKLSPVDVYRLSLELNNGDVYAANLTAHNMLRAQARGKNSYLTYLVTDRPKKVGTPDFNFGFKKNHQYFKDYLQPIRGGGGQ